MIAGIIVMLIAIFTSPPLFITMIFEKSIYLLNLMIHAVASADSFVIQNIAFNSYYLLTFYLLIISGIIWLKKPNFTKMIFIMSSLILVQLSFIIYKIQIERGKEFIIYNQKNNTLISTRTGRNIVFYKRDVLSKNNQNDRIINSYLVGNSVSPHARPFNRQWPMRQRRRPWRWIAIGRSSFHPAESRRTGPLGVTSCRYVTLYSWTVV
mgnify:CR=1 FL=1